MTDREIQRIADNDREWRRFMITEIRDIRMAQDTMGREIERMKVWTWISRGITVGLFATMWTWFTQQLK